MAFANYAALARLGLGLDSAGELARFSGSPESAAELRTYLRRCSGSRSPLLGAIELRGADGGITRFRCHGGLLQPAQGDTPARLLLRLSEGSDERFAALTQKVRDLDDEVRRRRRTQALLEEALRDRDVLMRELHHRVKNNIHMLAGMLSAARRETVAPEAAMVLDEATRRLAAVGAVHQMLYLKDNLRGVHGDEFVTRIATMIMEGAGAREQLSVAAEPIEIPNDAAVPLALVLNELLANALKHAARADGTCGRVYLGFAEVDAAIELSVEDEGPGFDPLIQTSRRASGLGLVRGLTRQIGGSFSVGPGRTGGARCVVRFHDRRETVAAAGTLQQ
ncbi:sensor histidine kinase [Siccirubricoccus deserti]|uniref:histidine kinase n=1 Tax=Siccirubricoccus deserti TaxID=2013562 RepID=A0A9X0UBU1_9PROT|nr:sensor histidine kinase [Siccirubricoccus deserti]MBC4013691.1 sensor histidine kinase [Siccirubricoccus deserti]